MSWVFFYAYLCIVKAVAARKTGPLTARQTNLRKSIEEMNKQLIKKFKKYDDTFVNRPLGKPDETVRGRLLKWNGSDYVAFEPQKSKDTPARTVIKEQMSGRLFRLCSEINKIIDSNKF